VGRIAQLYQAATTRPLLSNCQKPPEEPESELRVGAYLLERGQHDGAHGIEEQFVEVEVGSVNARTSDHDGRSGNVPSWRECKEMWSPPDQADAVRESRTGTTRTCLLAFRLNHRHSSPVLRFHKPYWRR
jgi:hypothetical protein